MRILPRYCWWVYQLRLVVYPIICKVLYIPGVRLGFLPWTVVQTSCFQTGWDFLWLCYGVLVQILGSKENAKWIHHHQQKRSSLSVTLYIGTCYIWFCFSYAIHLDHLLKYMFVAMDSFPEYLETNIRTQNTEDFHAKTCPWSHDFHVASLCFVFFSGLISGALFSPKLGSLKMAMQTSMLAPITGPVQPCHQAWLETFFWGVW